MWFNYSQFEPSEHGIKVTAPVVVFTKDKQHAISTVLISDEMKLAEIHQQLVATYRQNCFATMKCVQWLEMFKSSLTNVVDADR